MTLKLNGSSSGSVSIDAPASTTGGADVTFKLPVADGTSGQSLTTNASGQLAFSSICDRDQSTGGQSIGTGTTYEYTPGIPDTAKIIYLTFDNVSCDGTDKIRMQLGTASAYTTSGYANMVGYASNGASVSMEEQTTYIGIPHSGWGGASNNFSGYFQFVNHVDNKWMYSGHITEPDEVYMQFNHGFIDVDIKRFKFYLSGSNSFDSGTVNCTWIS